jgi:hypothetical protein
MDSLPEEIAAKLNLLNRLLISYNDFHHASRIASYILEHRLQDKAERLHGRRRYRIKLLCEALNSAMIVAYCRPFSGNDRGRSDTLRSLPARFLNGLSTEELEVHQTALSDRNRLLAHSDSEAWNMRPFFFKSGSAKPMLLPLHRDVRAPLVHDPVDVLQRLCGKLMDRIFEERAVLEEGLAEILPGVTREELEADSAADSG